MTAVGLLARPGAASTVGAVVRLRLAAYLRSLVVIAPTLATLVVIALLYGGGVATAEEAYGVSAVALFPVLAWQVKILLDAEPEVQRRLVRVAAGADREIAAGLIAGMVTAGPTIVLALGLPWLFGGITLKGSVGLAGALALGFWAHALAALAAVVLGAWSSRAVARSAGIAVSLLVGGSVLAIVIGLAVAPVRWLAPPLMSTARALAHGITAGQVATLTVWALLWLLGAGWAYVAYRRANS